MYSKENQTEVMLFAVSDHAIKNDVRLNEALINHTGKIHLLWSGGFSFVWGTKISSVNAKLCVSEERFLYAENYFFWPMNESLILEPFI